MALMKRRCLQLAFILLVAFSLMHSQGMAQTTSEWHLIPVPGPWQTNGPAAAKNHRGIAWYRTWILPHENFFTKHERNLFEESVLIDIRDLADAHELFVNGQKIGAGGAFPPQFKSGKDEIHRHKIPMGLMRKGEWNEIALRVYNESGPGGFLGEAPFIMNYFWECVLEGTWEFRVGDGYQPGGALTNRPTTSAFDQFRESSRVLGRTAELVHGPKMSPEESLQQLTTADELKVELLLHEPTVAQPTHFSFDERGRLWVTQYRQYPYPAGLTMLSRDKFFRSHYDKVPPAPPNHDRGADIISIHEDTDGDGQFDRHKVFQDGLNMATSAVRGRGGVWVTHPPYLLFYPDKNFDDIPDGPPVVHLAGFGLEDTHSVANGLVWGMDGWLYGAHGSPSSSRVTRPGIDPADAPGVYFEGCMVWRYHPESRAYEIFAEGSGNVFGLEVDAQGRLFSGHNGAETRGFHYVQGGIYPKQHLDPGKFGPPRNPYSFGGLPAMKTTNQTVRFTHFGAFAEGTALPGKFANRLFALDPVHNVVLTSERLLRGATFETVDREPALRSADPAFRPVFIANAPDGSLFIADFYEYYIAHGQHYQSQIDPTTGRIFRLRGTRATLDRDINLAAKTSDQLIALLAHPNKWHRHTAVRLLGERKDPETVEKLKQLISQDTGLGALNALWALHQSFGLDETTALQGLKHPYAPVRAWTVRLLGDQWGVNRGLGLPGVAPGGARTATASSPALNVAQVGLAVPSEPPTNQARRGGDTAPYRTRAELPSKLFAAVLAQAQVETDAEVLSQFASTARRLNASQALLLVSAVMNHDEVASDPYIPLLCWWVFEALIPQSNEAILALFKSPEPWNRKMVSADILPRLARRYAVEGKRQDLLLCAQLFRAAPTPQHAAPLMQGFEEAFRGRAMTGLPEELIAAISASGQAPLIFRVKQGDTNAVSEAIGLMQNAKTKPEERVVFVRAFGETRQPAAVPALLSVLATENDSALRKAALVSLATYDNDAIAAKVLELLPSLSGDVRTAALTMLASRPRWSAQWLAAIEKEKFSGAEVPADIAEQLRSSRDEQVKALAEKLFPKQEPAVAAEFKKRIAEVETILKRGTGNPYAGEALYMSRCASCHKLFFKGTDVGPDLTHHQRDNLGTMLTSIIHPNAEIREGYQAYNVETADERSLTGFIVDRDNQVTVLRDLSGEKIALRASEITEVRPMSRSLMPDGLLDDLSEQELRDLFAYLRISQPITK